MGIFVDNSSVDVINAGAVYLRIEGTFYIGIGILFMLYGYYRAINKPMTKPNLKVIRNSERHLEEKIDEMVKTALDTVEVIACRGEV